MGWTDFGDSFGFGEMPKMRGSVRPQGSGPVSSYFSSQEEKIKEASASAGDLQPELRLGVPVPDIRDPKLPRLVRAAIVVPSRLEIYGREIHEK